jgi:alkylated DNA repair dioxygenase AlkB
MPEPIIQPLINLLPADGEAYYYPKILDAQKAQHFFQRLLTTIAWKNDEAFIFGKHFITKRKAAWYGNEKFTYTYSNKTKEALAWTEELWILRNLVEEVSASTYNACLLNLYHSGEEGMSWHSDDEKELAKNGAIASLSLGASRTFLFRHKATMQTISLVLESGSLLVMKGETQRCWLHALPKTKKVKEPRINLTFRTMTTQKG